MIGLGSWGELRRWNAILLSILSFLWSRGNDVKTSGWDPSALKDKDTDRNFTLEFRLFFKACRIVVGDLDLSLIFTFPVTVPPIFGSDVESLRGKSFTKILNISTASRKVFSTGGWNGWMRGWMRKSRESTADCNASSAVLNTLFSSQWNGMA